MHWIVYVKLGLLVLRYLKRPKPDDKETKSVAKAINDVGGKNATKLARALLKEAE